MIIDTLSQTNYDNQRISKNINVKVARIKIGDAPLKAWCRYCIRIRHLSLCSYRTIWMRPQFLNRGWCVRSSEMIDQNFANKCRKSGIFKSSESAGSSFWWTGSTNLVPSLLPEQGRTRIRSRDSACNHKQRPESKYGKKKTVKFCPAAVWEIFFSSNFRWFSEEKASNFAIVFEKVMLALKATLVTAPSCWWSGWDGVYEAITNRLRPVSRKVQPFANGELIHCSALFS